MLVGLTIGLRAARDGGRRSVHPEAAGLAPTTVGLLMGRTRTPFLFFCKTGPFFSERRADLVARRRAICRAATLPFQLRESRTQPPRVEARRITDEPEIGFALEKESLGLPLRAHIPGKPVLHRARNHRRPQPVFGRFLPRILIGCVDKHRFTPVSPLPMRRTLRDGQSRFEAKDGVDSSPL